MTIITQSFEYETDSLDSFETVLETMVKIMFDKKPSKYAQMFVTTNEPESFYSGSRWVAGIKSKPKYLHVCSVENYKPRILKGDAKFKNYTKLIRAVMKHLKTADPKKFFKECSDGYHGGFNRFDGSVHLGYRLDHRSYGWDNLDVSLCHIYYGK